MYRDGEKAAWLVNKQVRENICTPGCKSVQISIMEFEFTFVPNQLWSVTCGDKCTRGLHM